MTHLSQYTEGQNFLVKSYVDKHINSYDDEKQLIADKAKFDEVMLDAYIPLQSLVSNSSLLNSAYQTEEVIQNIGDEMGHTERHYMC